MAFDGKEADPCYLKHLGCYQTAISYSTNGTLTCLYKLKKGFMQESHGIEVAKAAGTYMKMNLKKGLPKSVIDSAINIHQQLKTENNACI